MEGIILQNPKIIKMKKENVLLKPEQRELDKTISYVKNYTYKPYKFLSGGFVESKVLAINSKRIIIEVKWGVQNDIRNETYTKQVTINRANMKPLNY